MKKPSTLLRSLSSRFSTRFAPSPAVAPWPPVRSAYDRWLAAELDELRADPLAAPCASATWIARALGIASAAQRRLVAATATGDDGRIWPFDNLIAILERQLEVAKWVGPTGRH
ncbi:hypothetical protein GUJ93_ZPchr0011g27513 [Zizania palustris]|uniref:Uncharacterized protein n=1 Tax=Zizania palustris TaxID=103762 RepID=A0A8J5WHI7_ZIZPA|nr:hypothetical protein GUJ93_ZPchr0011g27513 [Zizania palustris]